MLRNRADVNLDRRRELLADHRLHRLAEQIVIRKLERMIADALIEAGLVTGIGL
jgi:hypothetical protein